MSQVQTEAQVKKSNRQKFGLTGQPVTAVKAYVRKMNFDHDNVNAQCWILISPDGKRIHLSTYDGALGKNVDPATFTYDMLDEKAMKKKLKGYTEVDVSECPIAVSPATGEEASDEEVTTSDDLDDTPESEEA